jgi:arylsulfatase A-like enzyme
MMNDYYNHRRHGINYMRQDDKEIDPPGHATDLFSSWAVDYIQSRSGAKKPFFLYLAYNAPHVPVQPPDDWLRRVNARQKNIDQTRAKLVAFIEHLDYGIGRVISALRETNAYDNTLIIFTSDNGGQLNVGANNGPFTGSKQQMFEGGICVSFAAVWPGKIKPASSSETVALTMDIFPTVCEAAGAAFSHEIDGRSFLQTLLGKSQPEQERFLFWVRREGNEKSPQPYYKGGRAYYAARYGRWKLLQNNPFEPLRLYDLKADPKEQNPLSQEHPAYKKLVVALKKHIIKAGAVPWQKYPVELPPDNWNK